MKPLYLFFRNNKHHLLVNAAEYKLEIIPLQNRAADEAMPALQPLVSVLKPGFNPSSGLVQNVIYCAPTEIRIT